MRLLKLAAAASAVLYPLSVFSADATVLEAAKKERVVTWYTGFIVNQMAKPLADAFEAKYPGLKVQLWRGSAIDQVTKVTTEAKANKISCDVVDGSTTVFPLKADGLLEPIPTNMLTEYSADFFEKDRLWASVARYFLTTAYNTQLVSAAEAPKTYEDLLNPKWKNKIAWALDWQVNGPPGFMGNIYSLLGEKKGLQYLEALSKQNVVIVHTAQRALLDQVIGGQYPIIINAFMHHAAISKKQGAPIEWLKMEPILQTSSYVALIKGAPHPNAAKLFLEFFMSKDGQEILAKGGYIPSRPNTETTLPEILPENTKYKVSAVDVEQIYKSMPAQRDTFKRLFGQ